MTQIKKIRAAITAVKDISPTAREVSLTLSEPFPFIAGSFVNVFMRSGETVLRRAFSISSSDQVTNTVSLLIRLNPQGAMSPLFWKEDIVGTEVEIMGPLGLNTADKIKQNKIYLFGFGVGAGVIKSLADHLVQRENVTSVTVMLSSRTEAEILYKGYFDKLQEKHPCFSCEYTVTKAEPDSCPYKTGYIQSHLDDYDFNQAEVYVCGQEAACDSLVEKVKTQQPAGCSFMVEGFH